MIPAVSEVAQASREPVSFFFIEKVALRFLLKLDDWQDGGDRVAAISAHARTLFAGADARWDASNRP